MRVVDVLGVDRNCPDVEPGGGTGFRDEIAQVQLDPRLGRPRSKLDAIRGTVPRLTELPSGCRFRNRCDLAEASCASVDPVLEAFGEGRRAACPVTMRAAGGKP